MPDESSRVAEELERQLSQATDGRIELLAIWDAAGRPRGKSPVKWATLIRLSPEPAAVEGPGRKVLATPGIARYYAHYLDRTVDEGLIGRPALLDRGWTETMIRLFLPEPDATRANPHHRSGPRMRLYLRSRVEAIESTTEFRETTRRVAPRREAASRAVRTKLDRMGQRLDSIVIKVPEMDWDTLIERACRHYNNRTPDAELLATPDSDAEFLERIALNYLRHVLTSYDEQLEASRGKVGADLAYERVNEMVYEAIGETYPELGAECSRQLVRKLELAEYRTRSRRVVR